MAHEITETFYKSQEVITALSRRPKKKSEKTISEKSPTALTASKTECQSFGKKVFNPVFYLHLDSSP